MRGQFYSPGLGTTGTEALFPISSGLALMGRFEDEEQVFDVPEHVVAAFNGFMIGGARRQIYARDAEFVYRLGKGEKSRRGADIFHDVRFNRPRKTDSRVAR